MKWNKKTKNYIFLKDKQTNFKRLNRNRFNISDIKDSDIYKILKTYNKEPKIEDTLGFSNGLKGNQTYNDVAEKIATIK